MKNSLPKRLVAVCALLVLAGGSLAQQTSNKRTQGDCSKIDQETLAENVRAKIASDPRLNGQNIKVEINKRVTTLTGNVSSPDKKQIAWQVAGSVTCIARVVNNLKVTPPIALDFRCCCDGECWIQSRPCPVCGDVGDCVKDYQSAIKEAAGNKDAAAAARQKFYDCICRK